MMFLFVLSVANKACGSVEICWRLGKLAMTVFVEISTPGRIPSGKVTLLGKR